MATSGTRDFTPTFADMLSEAFSRIQIRAANVVEEHITEAIRSANLMLIDFGNRGVQQYQLIESTLALTATDATYDLPAGTIDVWHAIYRRDDSDTPIWPISRSDYHSIPDKTNPGRPFNFFVAREPVGDDTRTITFWPVPDRADSVLLWVWVQPESVEKMNETLGISKEWFDAYAAALAARLGRKFAPALVNDLSSEAGVAFLAARSATRERRDLRIRGRGPFRRGQVV